MHSLLVVAAEIPGAIFLPKKDLCNKSDLLLPCSPKVRLLDAGRRKLVLCHIGASCELRCMYMLQHRWQNTSCVLKNVMWHAHQFLAQKKKAWCRFIFRSNNSLCRCKPNVFSDRQTCPGFPGWMVTLTLTARLPPENVSVYLDISLMIVESSKKGDIQPAIRKKMWQEHALQQRDVTAERKLSTVPRGMASFQRPGDCKTTALRPSKLQMQQ